MDSFEKREISLYNSVNTATPDEDVHSFDETTAPYVQNTGIERDGGITNIYEKETTYPDTGAHFVTEDGKVITAIPNSVSRTLKIDNKIVADVSAYGVQSRIQINGVDDCIITADSSYVTAVVNGSNVILTEYRVSDNVQLNQRTITFTSLANVTQFVTSISIVRYNTMHYTDSFEFALRLGDQVVILRESTPGQSIAQALQSSSVLGTNQINDVIVYGSFLVVAGNGGRVGSFDGVNWRNYDGSGTGAGPFNNGTVVGTNNILKLAVYDNYLIVGATAGLIGSFDGNVWYAYNSGGVFTNNATVISTDNVTAMAVITLAGSGKFLFVGGSAGKLGSGNTAAWTIYSSSGLADNATLIGAVQINAIVSYTDYEGYQTVVVVGASGRVGSFKWQSGTTYTFTTIPNIGRYVGTQIYGNGVFIITFSPGSSQYIYSIDGITWVAKDFGNSFCPTVACYGAGLFVALMNQTVVTSPDGITWTFRTIPVTPGGIWKTVTYGNGLFVAVNYTTSTTNGIATSPDGITWTFRTTAAPGGYGWYDVAYGNGLFVAVAFTTSTTNGIATSPDGITWTFRTTAAPGGTYGWNRITYGNGLFVATAYTTSTTNGIATSPDGITWTFRTTPTPGGTYGWNRITYGNGLFVAVSYTTSTTNSIATSPDGITWTFITSPTTSGSWYNILYGGGLFILSTYSTDSHATVTYSLPNTNTKALYTATSTQRYPTNNGTVVSTDNILTATIWNRRMIVAGSAGKVGEVAPTGDWVNYNTTRSLDSLFQYVHLPSLSTIFKQLAYLKGTYLLATSSTTGYVSTDSMKTWTSVTFPFVAGGIAAGPDKFVLLPGGSQSPLPTAYSYDGVSWNLGKNLPNIGSSPGSQVLGATRIVYTQGLYFVGISSYTEGSNSYSNIYGWSSSDGITWSVFPQTTAVANSYIPIVYGGGVYVALQGGPNSRVVYTSTDGTTWTTYATALPTTTAQYTNLAFGNGVFVASATYVSGQPSIVYSSNGSTWNTATAPVAGVSWDTGLIFKDGVFVLTGYIVGTSSTITAMSPDGINWITRTNLRQNMYTLGESLASSVTGPAFMYVGNTIVGMQASDSNSVYSNSLFTFSLDTLREVAVNNNAVVVGTASINAAAVFGTQYVVGSAAGTLGSFDGSQWKNYDGTGTGTGPYSNLTVVGANAITAMAAYGTKLTVGAANSILGSINADNSVNLFYNASGTVVANLLTGQTTNAYLYCYRYENGYYLLNLVGNALSKSYTLIDATKVITILNAAYCIPQVKSGVTRHITTTFLPDYTTVTTQVRATGLVGYTDFVTWTGTQVWPNAAFTLGNGNVLSANCGPGYEDFTFRTTASATNIYEYYSPQFIIQPQGQYSVIQSNTNTLINAYGKLNNQIGVPSSKPFEFRVGLIPTAAGTSGQLSYLSVALLDNKTLDILGTLITNVGEYDGTYLPMISTTEDMISYKYNNSFYLVKIGTALTNVIQRIGGTAYKINTISPLNILDTATASLSVGSSDYNGRMFFTSSAAPGTSTKIASVQCSSYSNSIDVGDKLVTISPITNTNYEVIGYRIPNVTTISGYAIDTYVNDLYYSSTFNDGSELIDVTKANLIYTNTPTTPKIVPVAIGQTYGYQSIIGNNQTIFLEQNNPSNPVPYDGYRIGNKIVGTYNLFSLNNGVKYLFDGSAIYSVTIGTAGFVSNKSFVAPATGLVFVALAPTMAYFVSSFDNSLWTFVGGQTLSKDRRMNQLQTIGNGIYNVHDNALLLQTSTELIWIRDDVLTINAKKATQTDLKLYNTTGGIILGNDVKNWQYSFFNQTGATVVPLTWQSAYFGRTVNQKSILSEVVYTIYDRTKSRHAITGYVYTRDPDTSTVQRVDWDVLPNMYTDNGYVTLRLKPETPKSLGTSFGLECDDKITVLDAVMLFTNDVNAVVDQKRSR